MIILVTRVDFIKDGETFFVRYFVLKCHICFLNDYLKGLVQAY